MTVPMMRNAYQLCRTTLLTGILCITNMILPGIAQTLANFSALPLTAPAQADVSWPLTPTGPISSSSLYSEGLYRFNEECPSVGYDLSRSINVESAPLTNLQIPRIHAISTGEGIRIALLDTGVSPGISTRVNLIQGGDLLGNGPIICSLHGTSLAGIIAAKPSKKDGFVGVAPGATITSYRVYDDSARISVQDAHPQEAELRILQRNIAKSIVAAVQAHNQIIVFGVTVCIDNIRELEKTLLPTLHWAHEQGVLLVAASGGSAQTSNCSVANNNQTSVEPEQGTDHYPRSTFPIIPLPAASPDVLSITGMKDNGMLTGDSFAGPWVSFTAPVENSISVNPFPNKPLTVYSATTTDDKTYIPISDAGVATAEIAGIAATVWSKYPFLSEVKLENVLKRTALSVGARVSPVAGYGVINPFAALTYDVPVGDIVNNPGIHINIPVPPPPPQRNYHSLTTAIEVITGFLGTLAVISYCLAVHNQRRKKKHATHT